MESSFKETFARTHPFTKLRPQQREKIFALTHTKEYQPGEIVYEEGSGADYIYILAKGRLIASSCDNGEETEIELIKKGKPFGIISVLTEEPHSVTVRAIESSIVLLIEKEKFRKLLMRSPRLAFDFSQMLSKRVKKRSGRSKKIFQSLTVAIASSTPEADRIPFLTDLARQLFLETKRKIVCVEIALDEAFTLGDHIARPIPVMKSACFDEEAFSGWVVKADGVDVLCVKVQPDDIASLFSLFNYLAENYHFVFYALPPLFDERLLQTLSTAHVVFFLSARQIQEPMIIHKIEQILKKRKGRLNILESLCVEGTLDKPKGALPDKTSQQYFPFLKKIARSLGEKTIGIVLGSGGAFGCAHIGVLDILDEQDIPIDIIAGSSMGAFIAALWALDYPREDIIRYAKEFGGLTKVSPFSFLSLPFKGFFKAKKIEAYLKEVFGDKDFSSTSIQLRIVAFDFLKRQSHIIEEGLIYKAVAASCAMPGVIEPILFEDTILLDGGILNPVPVSSVTDYAKKIIAVNVTPSREEIVREYRKTSIGKLTIFDFIFGSIETMQREFIEKALNSADCIIHPDMGNLRWTEFQKIEEFIERGRETALSHLEHIIRLRDE